MAKSIRFTATFTLLYLLCSSFCADIQVPQEHKKNKDTTSNPNDYPFGKDYPYAAIDTIIQQDKNNPDHYTGYKIFHRGKYIKTVPLKPVNKTKKKN